MALDILQNIKKKVSYKLERVDLCGLKSKQQLGRL